MFFSAFQRIRIVNLPVRTDRRAHMEKELASLGLKEDKRVAFFSAIIRDDPGPFLRVGSHGAFLSHLTLLKEAAISDDAILILQDDCKFLYPDINQFSLPDQWDIFYGGYEARNPENLQNSEIIGAHFMGFSPRAAKIAADYLMRYIQPDFPPDAQAAEDPGFDPSIKPPIDGAFVWLRRAHPELVTVFAMLGVQRSSRTDIGHQRWFDKIYGLRWLIEQARQIQIRMVGRSQKARGSNIRFGALDGGGE